MRPEQPFVSVVVPVLNGADTLADCLHSILASDYPQDRREIVVVDNGSIDGTADVAKRYPVRYVKETQRGLSPARNRGIETARGQILAFTDADCTVAVSWLRELVSGFDDPSVFAVVGDMVSHPPTTAAQRYMAMRKPRQIELGIAATRPWFAFASVAVRRAAFGRVGLLDPQFKGGCEDIDFAWRLSKQGLAVRCRPQAVVFHRYRTNSRHLLRQHIGSGGSQALLRRKYPGEVSWTLSDELRAWRDLFVTGWTAAKVYAFEGSMGRSMRFYFPFYEFIRKLGQRVGFLYGLVSGRAPWRR